MRLVVLGLRFNIHATAPSNITLNGHGSAHNCVVIMKDGKIFKNTMKQLSNNQTHKPNENKTSPLALALPREIRSPPSRQKIYTTGDT